jgi:subtilisin family serine protease
MPRTGQPGEALREALNLSLDDIAQRELASVNVTVLDSGIDATHPALVGRVAGAWGVEDGRLVEKPTIVDNDAYGHGTAVGCIITKIAPNARLFDIRVLRPGNIGSGEDLIEGLEFAVRARYAVINMSLAAPPRFAATLISQCERAYYQDQVVIASRRNTPFLDEGLPATFASVLGVDNALLPSAVSVRYRRNCAIELEAPGDQINVAKNGGGYTLVSGSSFATPVVTGVCALLLGAYPDLRPYEVRAILCSYGLRT